MRSVPETPGYDLLKYLGGGPLTCVYSARECATDEIRAVKAIRPDCPDETTAIKLMHREARAGLLVQHPNLIRLHYAHVTRAPYFLAMDLLPGDSLRERLRRVYHMEVSAAIWIARQVAEALTALHRARFIHGDVKPENIRLVDAGTAILIDLGFTHRPGENVGIAMGTPDYMAPEVCAMCAGVDPSSDLFSLGVTLFEMLTGELPYPPGSQRETMRRHCSEPPADLRERSSRLLPPGLVMLVERLLALQPAERPRAASVVQQLIGLEIASLRRRRAA